MSGTSETIRESTKGALRTGILLALPISFGGVSFQLIDIAHCIVPLVAVKLTGALGVKFNDRCRGDLGQTTNEIRHTL